MRISDWSSDVCSSDLMAGKAARTHADRFGQPLDGPVIAQALAHQTAEPRQPVVAGGIGGHQGGELRLAAGAPRIDHQRLRHFQRQPRSEEHTSEPQSLMRISYAVFCLKKKKIKRPTA